MVPLFVLVTLPALLIVSLIYSSLSRRCYRVRTSSVLVFLLPGEQVKEVRAEGRLELKSLRFKATLILYIGASNKARKFMIVAQSGFFSV